MKFEIYKDTAGEWRWRLKAGNGEKIADSAEGYKSKADCVFGITLVRSTDNTTPIVDLTQKQ